MKKVVYLLLIVAFLGCDNKDEGMSETERQAKLTELRQAETEIESIRQQITVVNAQIAVASEPEKTALRYRLMDLMHDRGELERKITRLKKELGLAINTVVLTPDLNLC